MDRTAAEWKTALMCHNPDRGFNLDEKRNGRKIWIQE